MKYKKESLIEHLKYNLQFCPECDSYNVVYKKSLTILLNLWYCKDCKNKFKLPNKYEVSKWKTRNY